MVTEMKYVALVPYTVQSIMDEFMATCKLENVLKVDNTINNIGAMASHNLGVDKMYETESEWLIIISPAIRFGNPGGLDYIEKLKSTKYKIVESLGVFGWHLIAFHKDVIDKVGKWDTNFTPYGYDDLDFSIRIQKAFPYAFSDDEKFVVNAEKVFLWTKELVDVKDTIMSHSLKLNKINTDNSHHREYYERKWGKVPGTGEHLLNTYEHPFNNPENDITYFSNDYYNEWIEKESIKDDLNFKETSIICTTCGNTFKYKSTYAEGSVDNKIEINTCGVCNPEIIKYTKIRGIK
jgi:ribosomal protein L31